VQRNLRIQELRHETLRSTGDAITSVEEESYWLYFERRLLMKGNRAPESTLLAKLFICPLDVSFRSPQKLESTITS